MAGTPETLLAIGPDAIAARTQQLARLTSRALEEAGAKVVTPLGHGRAPAFLCFRTGDTIGHERRTVQRLAAAGVSTSLRFTTGLGGVRVSPYFYNDDSDIDRLVSIVDGICRRAPAR